MAILISQKNTAGTATPTNAALTAYNFTAAAPASATINTFFGISDTAETLTYNGGNLKVADVSNGDVFNITDVAHADVLALSLSGNNVVITDSTATKTYTLGAFVSGEAATVTFGEGVIGAKSINIINTAGTYTYGYAGEANTAHAFSGSLDTTAPATPTLTAASLKNTATIAVTHDADVTKVYLVNSTLPVTSQATNLTTLETTYSSKVKSTNATGTSTTAALTGLVDGIYSAYVVDVAGNWTAASTNKVTVDTTVPTLLTPVADPITGITVGGGSFPVDNATGVSTSENIVLAFSENVVAGTVGNVVITSTTPGVTDVRSIPYTDATQLVFSGSTLTINPTANLLSNTDYSVTIDATTIKDTAGNLFAGISLATTLNFTTGVDPLHGTVIAPVQVSAGDTVTSYINGNQGSVGATAVAFTASAGAKDHFVINTNETAAGTLPLTAPATNIAISSFGATNELVFKMAPTATGTLSLANLDALYSVSDVGSGTDTITLTANVDGGIQQIALSSITVTGGPANSVTELVAKSNISVAMVNDNGSISIAGGNGANYLLGGAGADTITGGAGADTISAGAGADKVQYSAISQTMAETSVWSSFATAMTVATADVIYGFGNGDNIDTTGAFTVVTAAAVQQTAVLAANTTDTYAFMSGAYDATAGTFVLGAASTTNNDYIFQWADGTRVNTVVLADVWTTGSTVVLTGVAAGTDTFTLSGIV